MKQEFKDGEELFKAIVNDPSVLSTLPKTYLYDVDFLELFYIILEDKIKPYIPQEIYQILKHHETICINQNKKQLENIPNVTLKDEMEILHDILQDPKAIEQLPTNEKYNSSFLEFLYIIWGDQIMPYIPYEMFEGLKNESLMNEYHHRYEQEHNNWAQEEHQKILNKAKNKNAIKR